MPFQLIKMEATGNDFLIADGRDGEAPARSERAAFARRYCDRRRGFGADGFLVLEKIQNGVAWDFYNSDGSVAAMCGNAARAVGRYLMDQEKKESITFQTKIGAVNARRAGPEIEVEFEVPPAVAKPLPYFHAQWVETGVPHAVIPVDTLEDQRRLRQMGDDVKTHFPKDGINVTFYRSLSKDAIASTTFERGVEEFTLSCGTGALAAVRVHLNGQDGTCAVAVPGGNLSVTYKGNRAILRGAATYVGRCLPYEGDQI